MSKPLYQIILRPMLTEKSVRLTKLKQYTFRVALDANKPEIAKAIEELYAKDKVVVAAVNTMHVRGKERRVLGVKGRRGGTGRTADWKKAVVTLAADSPGIPELEGA
jgi:large subunit ribosomal protein L23